MLYRSTDGLSRRGAPMKNLAHSASFESLDKDAPSKAETKHLVSGREPFGAPSRTRFGSPRRRRCLATARDNSDFEREGRAMTVTIYHNPSCLTSRNVLAMIRQSGEEPIVIEYLKNPPSRERLKELIKAMGIPVRALLREREAPYAELRLADPKWSDEQLLDFMMAHPILINRPIVVTPKGVKLCRPSEKVLDLLPNPI